MAIWPAITVLEGTSSEPAASGGSTGAGAEYALRNRTEEELPVFWADGAPSDQTPVGARQASRRPIERDRMLNEHRADTIGGSKSERSSPEQKIEHTV